MTQSVKSPICPLLCLSAAACLLRAVTLSCSPVFESGHCCHCASAERPRHHCCGVELSQPTVLRATSKKREHLSPRGDVYLSKVSNNEENTHSHRRNHAHPHCVWTQLTLWFCCFYLTFISVLTISQCGLIQQINTHFWGNSRSHVSVGLRDVLEHVYGPGQEMNLIPWLVSCALLDSP